MELLRIRVLALLILVGLIAGQLTFGVRPAAAQSGSNLARSAVQVITDSNYSIDFGGDKAKDGVVTQASKWTSANIPAPHWIAYDLGGVKIVTGFVVKHAGAAGEWTIFNTKQFRFQSASAINGPWFDEAVIDNNAQNNISTWNYSTPRSLRYVRLYVTNPGVDNYARIPEFEVWSGSPGATIPLPVPYISQYQGLSSSNCDCGPAAIAMILRYYNIGAGLSDQALVSQVRSATGNLNACTAPNFAADTTFSQLERAIGSYNIPWSEISNALSPQPSAQMQAMRNATNAGKPVIALISGYDLGRSYWGHWVVVQGFSVDGQTVYISDPDNQAARAGYPNWVVGGPSMQLSYATFSRAAYDAPAGPYGIIVGNGR